MSACCVYMQADGGASVVTQNETREGLLLNAQPMFKVAPGEDGAAVGAAVLDALQASVTGVATPENANVVLRPLLEFFAVKSWKAFVANVTHCVECETDADQLVLIVGRKARNGEFLHDPSTEARCGLNAVEIGHALRMTVSG